MKTALTIAGSDSSGGAGIQADIKAMTMNGVYAMSAITALTAQNTTGVRSIYEATPGFLQEEIDAVFEDIPPDAVKIGMVADAELIRVIAATLTHHMARNIVLDPVMVATSGAKLLKDSAIEALEKTLFPVADLVTPNIPEAEILTRSTIKTQDDMVVAAKKIYETYGPRVLLKGGHGTSDASDLYYDGRDTHWYTGRRIETENTHGTGCTLSSTIAANLAKGDPMETAIPKAKMYLTGALSAGLKLGHGCGPMAHNYTLPGIEI